MLEHSTAFEDIRFYMFWSCICGTIGFVYSFVQVTFFENIEASPTFFIIFYTLVFIWWFVVFLFEMVVMLYGRRL